MQAKARQGADGSIGVGKRRQDFPVDRKVDRQKVGNECAQTRFDLDVSAGWPQAICSFWHIGDWLHSE
jgi:hypothetical protein